MAHTRQNLLISSSYSGPQVQHAALLRHGLGDGQRVYVKEIGGEPDPRCHIVTSSVCSFKVAMALCSYSLTSIFTFPGSTHLLLCQVSCLHPVLHHARGGAGLPAVPCRGG